MSFLTLSKHKIDSLISIAVFIQPVLIILQHVMIDVFMMDPDATTIYRVMLSAIPMSLAIFFSWRRKPLRFLSVYSIVISIMIIHIFLFPQNTEYMKSAGLRFLLPMVIPSALCLTTIKNIDVAERALYHTSWIAFILVLFYVLVYILGGFLIESYNMSFSYGCLLPMVSFYRHRTPLSYCISLFLLISVLAIGSRGAAIVFIAYIIYDIFQYNKKYTVVFLGLLIIGFLMLPFLSEGLDAIGIHSRTLSLLEEGSIDKDSGRGDIYKMFLQILDENALLGIGLFGDRVYLDGFYCHNILLEMLLDWGYLGVMVLWPIIFIIMLLTYLKSDKGNKNRIVCYTLVLIGPLMASNSYLISPDFGIYCGMMYLIYKANHLNYRTKALNI